MRNVVSADNWGEVTYIETQGSCCKGWGGGGEKKKRRRKKVNEACTTTTGTKHTLNTLLHWVYQASRRIDHVLSSVAT